MSAASIRPEGEDDAAAVAAVNRAAFGGEDEVGIVTRLREAGLVAISLVTEEGGALTGHILLSRLDVSVDGRAVAALALAPMAVVPGRQRTGLGSWLVTAALAAAREAGYEAVIVLGHPDYYPRFGFSAEATRHLAAPFAGPAFMALELRPGALAGQAGRVVYPDAFS